MNRSYALKQIDQINKLTNKTRDKKVPWESLNPDAYRWVQLDIDHGRIFTTILQRQSARSYPRVAASNIYFLTIQSTNPNEIILQVNSNDPAFKFCLERLYRETEKILSDVKAEKLGKLIDEI